MQDDYRPDSESWNGTPAHPEADTTGFGGNEDYESDDRQEAENPQPAEHTTPQSQHSPTQHSLPTPEINSDEQPPPSSAGTYPSQGYRSPYRQERSMERRGNGRTVMKAVTITVCALILIIASAFAFTDTDDLFTWPSFDLFDSDDSLTDGNEPGVTPPDTYDDYRDYFDNYFYQDDSASSEVYIATTKGSLDASFDLSAIPSTEALSYQEIYEKCASSVVGITASITRNSYSWGSGIIISPDGYIVTNHHVVSEATDATVTLSDGKKYTALLVGYDYSSDLAVLKIDAKNLPYAEFGDSDLLSVGDGVVAIGNPLGVEFSGTMTNGIVSAINRNIAVNNSTMTMIQTNAAINEGNSGGPLINMYGQVIGITNLKMVADNGSASIEGIGLAIPSTHIKSIIDQILEYGYVIGEPVLGITAGSIDEDRAELYNIPVGLYVATVDEKSDAYAKGLRAGDIITTVNGVQVYTVADVADIKGAMSIGGVLNLTVYRDGSTFELAVELVNSNDLG